MNEGQYRDLCEACDCVLLSPRLTIERMAIPWLHVIREHPLFLEKYSELFQPAHSKKVILSRLSRILRNAVSSARSVARMQSSEEGLWFSSEMPACKIDVLFVSHLLNVSHAGQSDDFYFGNVPGLLVEEKYSTLIALINHSGRSGRSLAGKWAGSTVPRVVFSRFFRRRRESALHRRLKKESLYLSGLAKEQTPGMSKRVFVRASEEALSSGARAALRVASQVKALVTTVRPKAIVVTYEGHAWERVVFAAAREVRPDIVCVGYQHAAPFRLQHAIGRSLASEFNPDHILTAGKIGKSRLESSPSLGGIPVSVMGSTRHVGANVSAKDVLESDAQEKHIHSRGCLVIPEGIKSECEILFEFSMVCARACPGVKFIWRLHPILSYKSLVKRNSRLKHRPSNVVLSQDTLEIDIAKCRWALHRGTTAVIQSVIAGIRPIYLHRPGEMTIDPLYDLKDWGVIVETIDDFKRVLKNDIEQQSDLSELTRKKAKLYCSDIFQPLEARALIDVVRKKSDKVVSV